MEKEVLEVVENPMWDVGSLVVLNNRVGVCTRLLDDYNIPSLPYDLWSRGYVPSEGCGGRVVKTYRYLLGEVCHVAFGHDNVMVGSHSLSGVYDSSEEESDLQDLKALVKDLNLLDSFKDSRLTFSCEWSGVKLLLTNLEAMAVIDLLKQIKEDRIKEYLNK